MKYIYSYIQIYEIAENNKKMYSPIQKTFIKHLLCAVTVPSAWDTGVNKTERKKGILESEGKNSRHLK